MVHWVVQNHVSSPPNSIAIVYENLRLTLPEKWLPIHRVPCHKLDAKMEKVLEKGLRSCEPN